MKFEYKVGDIVKLKKSSDIREEYGKAYDVTIIQVDEDDYDDLPYEASYKLERQGKTYTTWLEACEIKCLAKKIFIGGE